MHHQTNSHWICLIKRQLLPKQKHLHFFLEKLVESCPNLSTALQDHHLSGPVYQTVWNTFISDSLIGLFQTGGLSTTPGATYPLWKDTVKDLQPDIKYTGKSWAELTLAFYSLSALEDHALAWALWCGGVSGPRLLNTCSLCINLFIFLFIHSSVLLQCARDCQWRVRVVYFWVLNVHWA